MLRCTIAVSIISLALSSNVFGQTSVDSIARSLEDISSKMSREDIRRSTDESVLDQMVYFRQLAVILNQRLTLVAQNANAAVLGWQKAEQLNKRLIAENNKLKAEIARLKRDNRDPQPEADVKQQFEAYESFVNTTLSIYSTAVSEKRPALIEQHVLQYWQLGAKDPSPNPRVELQIFDADPLAVGRADK